MDPGHQKEIAQAINQQLSLMRAFASITQKCFIKCVTRPSRNLSHTEDACVTNCVDRHHDAQEFLMKRFREQAEIERTKSGMISEQ